MKRTNKIKKAIFLTLISTMLADITWAESIQSLFIIEQSKNNNILRYDARISNDGNLLAKKPLIAYWVLRAEDGRRKDLSWLEKKMAYRFDFEKDTSGKYYRMRMRMISFKEREIKIYQEGDRVKAVIIIDGRPCSFEKVYISTKEGLWLPKIDYIELYGRDIITGERRYEKILPK